MRKIAVCATALSVIQSLSAAVYEINAGAPGDISSAQYWQSYGYQLAPCAEDTVYLNLRATGPTFTSSEDMSIHDMKFGVSGSYIDLSGTSPEIRINAPSGGVGMQFEAAKAGFQVKGGTWYFVNKAHLYCGYYNEASKDKHIITFEETVVTNVNRFYGAFYDRETTVTIKNGTKVYADELRAVYGERTSNAVLRINSGSQMILSRRMVYDQLNKAYDYNTSEAGGNLLEMTGEGTLLSAKEPSFFGFMTPSNTWQASSKAKVDITALTVGSSSSCGNTIAFSGTGTVIRNGNVVLGESVQALGNRFELSDGVDSYNTGTYTIGKASEGNSMSITSAQANSGGYIIGELESSSNNALVVSGSSDVTIRSGHSITVGKEGSGNSFELRGGNLVFLEGGMIKIGAEAMSSGNVCRIVGETACVSSTAMLDPFGAGAHNVFSLEDGAKLGNRLNAVTASQYCTIRVKNAVLDTDKAGFIGSGTDASKGNRLEIVDGSVATFQSFSINSYDNGLIVSNSTFYADDPTRGIRLGYTTKGNETTPATVASNCMITVAGDAKIETTGYLECRNFSHLHFGVPETGWKVAPVQVALHTLFTKGTRLTIDCTRFAETVGGEIRLISSNGGFNTENLQNVLDDANSASDLPPGGRFMLSGNELVFRCPHKGRFTVVFR